MTGALSTMVPEGFEQVAYGHDAATGLQAIVAIHSTVLGPSLGGTRFWPFATEGAALVDVCRLASGGKAVIIGDPATIRTDELILAFARFVDGLGGRYVTAEDVGTTQADMDLIRTVTPHVRGVSEDRGGSGDPSPATALGVLWAMKAVAERRWGTSTLDDRHVCISGVGKVGAALADHLHAEGARLSLADVRPAAVAAVTARTGAGVVPAEGAHTVDCDIFSPCALGAVLSASTIPHLGARAVVGSANNQLATEQDAQRIHDSGVLYAPDYVANAGGVINVFGEVARWDREHALSKADEIYDTVLSVFEIAKTDGVPSYVAADRLAERRLKSAGKKWSPPR